MPEGPEGLNIGFVPDSEAAVTQVRSTSSARSRPLVIVPRRERRGLLSQLVLIPEVERPYDYSRGTKWIITLVVALAAAGGPLGSGIFYPALSQISAYFHTSETIVNLTVAFYMLAMAIFPLWWSSFSETLGRRTIYVVSFSLFVVFGVLSAISTNIGMLIAFRVLGGGAAASVQAVGAGTISDLWEPFERGSAMGIFYLGPLAGPLIAPIVGGALAQGFNWQATMWFLTAFGGFNLVCLVFLLPETLARPKPQQLPAPASSLANTLTRTSTRQSIADKSKRGAMILRKGLIEPLSCILLLRFPPVALTVALSSVTYTALYMLNICIQSTFDSPPYSFSIIIVGLLYIPVSLGYFGASLIGGRWVDKIMLREANKAGQYDANGKLIFLPEYRLRENAWVAASMYPFAMIWFGWCADKGVFWLAASVANFFFGLAAMIIFGASTTMLTEFMPKKSSSGVALNNFVRSALSCVGIVVTQPLIDAMGVGWLCTMIALFAWITANVCILLLLKKSPGWRKMMDEQMGNTR